MVASIFPAKMIPGLKSFVEYSQFGMIFSEMNYFFPCKSLLLGFKEKEAAVCALWLLVA